MPIQNFVVSSTQQIAWMVFSKLPQITPSTKVQSSVLSFSKWLSQQGKRGARYVKQAFFALEKGIDRSLTFLAYFVCKASFWLKRLVQWLLSCISNAAFLLEKGIFFAFFSLSLSYLVFKLAFVFLLEIFRELSLLFRQSDEMVTE